MLGAPKDGNIHKVVAIFLDFISKIKNNGNIFEGCKFEIS